MKQNEHSASSLKVRLEEKKCPTDNNGYAGIGSYTVAANFLLNLTKCQQCACMRLLQYSVSLWWPKMVLMVMNGAEVISYGITGDYTLHVSDSGVMLKEF